MGAIASQITSLTIAYSIVYSDADQRKHQSSASLAFVRGIHRGPVNSPHKWPVTRKCFHLMTSSWKVPRCEQDTVHGLSQSGEAFNRRRVIWWPLLKLEVPSRSDWCTSYRACENDISKVYVGCSKEFSVKVGVHQGFCPSQSLFVTVLKAISQECRTRSPWQDLYADDLIIISESLEELQENLIPCKSNMDRKGLGKNQGPDI